MVPAKYRLIGVLCGLIGALGANPKTEHTDAVILDALRLFARLPSDDSPETRQAVKAGTAAIRREKFTIVPGCAVCQSPCANNADYDMRRLWATAEPERTAKLKLLALLGDIAASLPASAPETPLTPSQLQLLMQAISFLAWESDPGYLQAMEQLLQDLLDTLRCLQSPHIP